MRRVVITGMGIWSSIGQDLQTVTESLKQGRSGIIFDQSRLDYGLQSGLVGNVPRPDMKFLPRNERIMLSEDAEYAYMAARQALEQSCLTEDVCKSQDLGIIWSNDLNSHQQEFLQIMEQEHCPALIGYNALPKSTVSSAALNLSRLFHLTGVAMNISASCAGSTHAIGTASMFIQTGQQDVVLVGGSFENNKESLYHLTTDTLFRDTRFNDTPQEANRPFDQEAVGSIPSGGAAALVLEEYEHAARRGATILAEVVGYGFASGLNDAYYLHKWETGNRAMDSALGMAGLRALDLSLITSRADAWPVSDQAEAKSLRELCGSYKIPITATDSISGHEGSMSGTSRTIYSILMMQNDFIAPTINLENVIDEAKELYIVREAQNAHINTIMINAAGLWGTYSTIIIKKL